MQKRRMKEKDVVRYLQEGDVVHSRPEVLPARLAHASRKHETPVRGRCLNVHRVESTLEGISPLSGADRIL